MQLWGILARTKLKPKSFAIPSVSTASSHLPFGKREAYDVRRSCYLFLKN